jgi:hypothetical protein
VPGGEKGGPAAAHLGALQTLITAGLTSTQADRARVEADVDLVGQIAATVEIASGSTAARRAEFEALQAQCAAATPPRHQAMGELMGRWLPGLFVGEQSSAPGPAVPADNYALERWFKLPKQHARHTHGRAHAGIVLVQRGPTRMLVLDAHREHPGPFGATDLIPWRDAKVPEVQQRTLARAQIMRRARSSTARATLLADLEARYRGAG